MYKEKLDNLLKRGVLTQSEYNKFFDTVSKNDKGEMIGIKPSERFCYKYDFDGNLLDGSLLDFVINEVTVPLGAEEIDPVFKIYGYSYFGICDGYNWITRETINDKQIENGHKPIEDANELELWKIIGICSRYWESRYKEWYEHK